MSEMFFYLPTLRIEVEKPGMPKKTMFVFRYLYRKFK